MNGIRLRHLASGWQRQKRWEHLEWNRVLFTILKHNAKDRTRRQGALRNIGSVLMTIYRNRADRNKLITRSSDARCRRYARRRALRRIIHTLMNVYRDEDGWVALLERQPMPKGTTTPTHANERPTCMTALGRRRSRTRRTQGRSNQTTYHTCYTNTCHVCTTSSTTKACTKG